VINSGATKTITELIHGTKSITCRFEGGSTIDLPAFLGRFIMQSDVLRHLSPGNGFLLERPSRKSRSPFLLYSTIGYVTQPRLSEGGGDFLVRTELLKGSGDLNTLFLSGDAIRRYFYGLADCSAPSDLYVLLQVSETITPGDLRMAWRIRQLESGNKNGDTVATPRAERAFNILAHADLRRCYDELRRNDDAPPLFPYSGFGSILVEGNLSRDGEAFFADRILAYKPEMKSRKVSLLLRQCEFLADRIVCRDRRRKLEVWLDSSLLGGIPWDLSWNQWKHWLRSRIEVNATFVHTGKYRLHRGKWTLREWYTALPSRLHVELPGDIGSDIERARAIHALLGEHADAIAKIRAEIEKQPVEHVQIQEWFDRIAASRHLRQQHVTWRPDYDLYYFEQLRKRSATWFLFQGEYLFVWNHVLISEVPQPGHATYVFARPSNVDAFMSRYSQVRREDVRTNRGNVATALGFVGRVVRGQKKTRWLADVLKLAGEKADYMEVFE
jgi:hypothetical protein